MSDLQPPPREMAEKNPGLKGVILDLRNNGGGVLQGAVGVAAAFLPDDATVVSTNGQVPDAKRVYKATFNNYRLSSLEDDPLKDLPPLFKKIPMIRADERLLGLGIGNRGRRAPGSPSPPLMGQDHLRQGVGADRAPADQRDRHQADHRVLLHADGTSSIQAQGIRPDIPVV